MPRPAAIAAALAAASALAAAGLAAAAEFPAISIERTCRSAKPLDAQDTQPVESCLKDERAARSELEGKWARFDESQRRMCAAQTHVGGHPSYVDVLTCLEMGEAARSTAGPRPKRRFEP